MLSTLRSRNGRRNVPVDLRNYLLREPESVHAVWKDVRATLTPA
jgi:hypothetical protein